MNNAPPRRWISYLFILGGAFLLYLGARDFFDSRNGQFEAARGFSERLETPPARRSPARPAPKRGQTLAKLVIPRLDAELYVIEGDGNRELRRGPGHIPGSALPGQDGNCIIAGHRDTHFRLLKEVREGDDILLQTDTGTFVYRVHKTAVISPEDKHPLRDTAEPYLNLITCYPFYYVGSAPKRFVVEARLAGNTPPSS